MNVYVYIDLFIHMGVWGFWRQQLARAPGISKRGSSDQLVSLVTHGYFDPPTLIQIDMEVQRAPCKTTIL